jgi:ribosomal protein S18 acetylase RimI-like enzyme
LIHYRSFRNTDPPALVEIWNQSFTGRGAVPLRHSNPLERHVFAKPYFDPKGLIIAEDNGLPVGFGHAGFGPNADEAALAHDVGIVCLIGVRASHRRQGIGSELLRRCEAYLQEAGAQTVFAGQMRPLTPFYLGLYGGSESSGILASDPAGDPFLKHHGYQVHDTSLVFQRSLERPANIVDGRFAALRRRYEMRILARVSIASWWQDCVLGLLEPVEFRLEDKLTNRPVAQALAWEMEGFSCRWNQPSVGINDLVVEEPLRRQGLAKFLLAQVMRYLQDQFFGLVEIQTMENNAPAVSLIRSVGFTQVDVGRAYRKADATITDPPK